MYTNTNNNGWMSIRINTTQLGRDYGKSTLVNMPHSSRYDGYSFWIATKLIRREGRHYKVSFRDDFSFTLKKYGNGQYNSSTVIDEKTVDANAICEAFAGSTEALRMKPAEDKPILHVPAEVEPVEVEALKELTDE